MQDRSWQLEHDGNAATVTWSGARQQFHIEYKGYLATVEVLEPPSESSQSRFRWYIDHPDHIEGDCFDADHIIDGISAIFGEINSQYTESLRIQHVKQEAMQRLCEVFDSLSTSQ